jgi:hypothetical protein
MKQIFVKECGDFNSTDFFIFDINKTPVRDCLGCWSCWWTTPGKCAHKDLDNFYHEYLTADKVIFFGKLTQNFVSGNMKSLFDRMICLFLPYTVISNKKRTRHLPRYEKYPDIEFYYDGIFKDDESKKVFIDYINYLFEEFYSKNILIKPISEFVLGV